MLGTASIPNSKGELYRRSSGVYCAGNVINCWVSLPQDEVPITKYDHYDLQFPKRRSLITQSLTEQREFTDAQRHDPTKLQSCIRCWVDSKANVTRMFKHKGVPSFACSICKKAWPKVRYADARGFWARKNRFANDMAVGRRIQIG